MAHSDSFIFLPDGRKLGYTEFGAPNGFPIINNHGGLLCRLDISPADSVARELGVRIISPDRPGIGLSDPKAERTLLDWASDVGELADQLRLEQFGLVGWSMGGQYALACAYQQAERVSAAAILAGCPPLDDPATFAALNKLDQRLTRLSEHAPAAAEATFLAMGEMAQHTPQAWNTIMLRSTVPPDAEAIRRQPLPGIAAFAAPALMHPAGMVEEYRAWVRPWGFRPEQITVPIKVWQGDADDLVPQAWAEEMTKRLPHAHLHLIAGEGHLLPYNYYPDILRELIPAALPRVG